MSKASQWISQQNQKLNLKGSVRLNNNIVFQAAPKNDILTASTNLQLHFQKTNTPRTPKIKQKNSPILNAQQDLFKSTNFLRLQDLQQRSKDREQFKKTKGLAIKMKAKIQQQIKIAKQTFEQKERDVGLLHVQINNLNNTLKQKKLYCEDIINKQQMLTFKENQFNNLITIHSEILEGAKKDALHEKQLKITNDQQILNLKYQISLIKIKWQEKQELIDKIDQINQEKLKLQEKLKIQKDIENKKSQIRSDAVRQMVFSLIKKSKKQIEEQCEAKIKIVRQNCPELRHKNDLKQLLRKKGLQPSSYFTYNQLKYVPQLNYKLNKQAQKIMQFFHKEVHPKIPEVLQHIQEPKQLRRLKDELKFIQKGKIDLEVSIHQLEKQIQQIEENKKQLLDTINEIKKKKGQVK